MADPGLKIHDVRFVVTQKSAAEASIRPASAAETDATVSNPAQARDGDLSSFAELTDASATAILDLTAFENSRLVSDAGRDWVDLVVVGDWGGTPAGDDDIQLDIRGASTESWTTLDNAAGGLEWDGSARTFDVTAALGEFPESGWQVRLTYTRGTGGTGTFQVADVRVEIGGDVVQPTDAELAEDVEELASAKFADRWAALTASVEAALNTFGSTTSDRAAILNAVRDQDSASDAEAALTAAADRARADAWAEVAAAVGLPRYTGST